MLGLIKILGLYFLVIIIFLVIILQFDYKHWNGIEKKTDDTIQDKILNRFYFLTTTFSTAGYGDITPKTKETKIIVIIMQICVLLGIVELTLEGFSK